MKKDNLKDYVFRKISEIEESTFPKKNDSDVSGFKSDSVANLVNEIKKINKSINLLNPLMGEGFSFVENDTIEEKNTSKKKQKDESTKRNLKTPMGKEYGIEMKEGLNETITNYNKEKSISHSKESEKDSFNRIMNYKPFTED